jgi:hypothetical protein
MLPRQHSVLAAWFSSSQGDPIATLDLAWWCEGWLPRTEEWIRTEAGRLGYRAISEVAPVKCAYTAVILRADTDHGALYFKAAAAPLGRELPVTQALARLTPRSVPRVLALNETEHWMLMEDIGGHPLDEITELPIWEDTVRAHAELQIRTSEHLDAWEALSVPDLRPEAMGGRLPAAFEQLPVLLSGLSPSLSGKELLALTDAVPAYAALCDELAGYGLPAVLEHGDLHAGNIRVTAGGPVFFYWSHARIAHPFFALGDLLADDDWFPDRPDAFARLRDAYLEPWTAFMPRERLQEAFALSERLYRLNVVLNRILLLARFQQRLSGKTRVAETPTGAILHELQWWLMTDARKLLPMAA